MGVPRDPLSGRSHSQAPHVLSRPGPTRCQVLSVFSTWQTPMNESSNRPTGSSSRGDQPATFDEPARAKVLRLVPADAQNRLFVEMLEEWIEAARAGRITNLVIAGVVDGDVETQFEGNYLEAIAGLELAKVHVMESMSEDED